MRRPYELSRCLHVRAWGVTFTETLLLDQPVAVKLFGGQNSEYTAQTGTTTLQGKLTVSGGGQAYNQVDLKVKFDRYERAGVREYWVVDPTGATVQIFNLGPEGKYGRPTAFGAGDRITVGIFPELEIDLATVFAE